MKRLKRGLLLSAVTALLVQSFSVSAAEAFAFIDVPALLRPGKAERISFFSVSEGPAELYISRSAGEPGVLILGPVQASPGINNLSWNGMNGEGLALLQGEYVLELRQGELTARAPLSVGEPGPRILSFSISDTQILPGSPWQLTAELNMPGELRLGLSTSAGDVDLARAEALEGSVTLAWDGLVDGKAPTAGPLQLSLTLTDAGGFAGNTQYILVNLLEAPSHAEARPEEPKKPAASFRAPGSEPVDPSLRREGYWDLPQGDFNEEAIWKAMMHPITVVEGGDQRETYKLRAAPDKSLAASNIVGEITYTSQGVNILEQRDDGWTLVETFNSSYGPKNRTRPGYGETDALIRGYVRTENLKTVTPREDYGLLIDKLKQRLYVFQDGKLLTELIISTGLPTSRQPWNETPTGEYLMVSRVGEFNAGNLVCPMGMRINGGTLIHEVPYILNEATQFKDYSIQERVLGEKASHGCIRVQRVKNADGFSMTWLWNNIKVNTKVLVWDDFPGRFYEFPPDDLPIFYNPVGGQYYHTDQNCPSIKKRFLPLPGVLSYAQLDEPAYARLQPCFSCNPPPRKSEIEAINLANGF